MRQILARLEVCSHGTITAYNSSGGHGETVRAFPPGERWPPHLEYRERFDNCRTDEEREQVIHAARSEYEHLTHRPVAAAIGLTDAQVLEERVLEHNGWDAVDVAKSLRCTVAKVRKVRLDRGRDGQTGETLELSVVDRADLVALLASRGLGQAEIAGQMGISQPTVSRLLRTRKVAA